MGCGCGLKDFVLEKLGRKKGKTLIQLNILIPSITK